MIRILLAAAVAAALALPAAAQRPVQPPVLPAQPLERANPALPPILLPRDRARVEQAILAERLDTVVPALMRAHKVDMWLLVAREYAEDPVVATMLDPESFHARRRTILVFFDPGGGRAVERLTVSRYGLGGLFAPAWDPAKEPDQWRALAALVAARDPKRIAINVSPLSALADGLTHSQHEELAAALPGRFRERLVPAETLAIGWLETRTPRELEIYPGIVRLAHALIAEAFSRKAITPGRTTADDVVWFYRRRLSELGIATWFQPSSASSAAARAGCWRAIP